MGEALTVPVAARGLQAGQQLLAQADWDLDLAHGLAETILKLTFVVSLTVAIGAVVEVAFQCCSLFRFQFARLGAGEIEQQSGGFTIHRSPSAGRGH